MLDTTRCCWSHSLTDYIAMFDLSDEDLQGSFIDFASQAASFNAQLTASGGKVISCDPLYKYQLPELRPKVTAMAQELVAYISTHETCYQWQAYAAIEDFITEQQLSREQFLSDYAQGLVEQRYLYEYLPKTNFTDYQFDIAVCTHFLFDGTKSHNLSFQLAAITEMARIARDVRIYPLLDAYGEIPQNLGPILAEIQSGESKLGMEIREVKYHFQKKSNAMLRVWPLDCRLAF